MRRLGIHTGRDLKARSLEELTAILGSSAPYYHGVARGIDERPVRAHRIRKSIGAENTFSDDSADLDVLAERLAPILDKVAGACAAKGLRGRTVTLKVKFSDFAQVTRARSLPSPVGDRASLEAISLGLLRDLSPLRRSVRLLGVAVSALDHGESPRSRCSSAWRSDGLSRVRRGHGHRAAVIGSRGRWPAPRPT